MKIGSIGKLPLEEIESDLPVENFFRELKRLENPAYDALVNAYDAFIEECINALNEHAAPGSSFREYEEGCEDWGFWLDEA